MLFAEYLNSDDAASIKSDLRERASSYVRRVSNGFSERQKAQPTSSSFLQARQSNNVFSLLCIIIIIIIQYFLSQLRSITCKCDCFIFI